MAVGPHLPSKACRVRPMPHAGSGELQDRTTTESASAFRAGAHRRRNVDGRIVVVRVRGRDDAWATADREDVPPEYEGADKSCEAAD